MIKRRISKVKRLGNCSVPTIAEITEDRKKNGYDTNDSSINNKSRETDSKAENKKRRQSTGSAKENKNKVKDLIQGKDLNHLPIKIQRLFYCNYPGIQKMTIPSDVNDASYDKERRRSVCRKLSQCKAPDLLQGMHRMKYIE
jgi:hypothetical protein